jgi:hypothetical protein
MQEILKQVQHDEHILKICHPECNEGSYSCLWYLNNQRFFTASDSYRIRVTNTLFKSIILNYATGNQFFTYKDYKIYRNTCLN